MDEIFIDAKKRLGPNAIEQFRNGQADDTIVTMFVDTTQSIFEKPMKDFREFFEEDEIEQAVPDNDCVISFMTETKVLQILGLDYLWWIAVVRNKKRRRLEKLFGTEEKKEPQEKQEKKSFVANTINCRCATIANDELVDITVFDGNHKDCVSFVNKEYQMRQLRSRFQAKIIFSIDCGEWLTFEKLVEKGVFTK